MTSITFTQIENVLVFEVASGKFAPVSGHMKNIVIDLNRNNLLCPIE